MTTLAPLNDGELIRSFGERIRNLENPSTQRVGSWVLSDKGGSLFATKAGSAPVALLGEALNVTNITDLTQQVAAPAQNSIDFGNLAGDLAAFLKNLAALFAALDPFSALFDPLAAIKKFITDILGATGLLPTIDQIVHAITGLLGGNLLDLHNWAQLVPELTSIGGTLLSAVIPGLDASKIISGVFAESPLQPFIDAVSQGFGGGTGLSLASLRSFLGGLSFGGISFDDLLGLIPGIGGGLSGSTGLGAVFTDITGLLGSPTGLGGGSPTLPGPTSIPLIGGLFSGSNFLTSLIPGIDASKIITGVFTTGQIPGLDVSKIISGVFGSGFIPGLDASKIVSGTFGAGPLQPFIDAVSQGFGGSTGLSIAGLRTFLGGLSFGGISFDDLLALIPGIGGGLSGSTGLGSVFTDLTGLLGSPTGLGTGTPTIPAIEDIPILGSLLDVADTAVVTALSTPIFQPLVNIVNPGGGGFPWSFPGAFGAGVTTITDVGQAIANATAHSQQVLDTIVQQYLGISGSGFSLDQLASALQQQPGGTLGTTVPAQYLPDITLGMSSALQTVHTATGLNTSQINDIVSYAEQESAAALGSFIGATSGVANAAQGFVGGAVDTINTVLGGIPFVGSDLKNLFDQFTGFLTTTHNNWTGSALPAAAAPDVAAAALNSATQANAQSVLIASINSQLPKFYGGGNSGLSYQTGFVGGLPAGFAAFTPGSGVVYNCAINTSQAALTDTQAVSGIWSTSDGWAKCLILRSNAAGTTHHWAWWAPGQGGIGVRVAGVDHTLLSFAAPAFVANYAYQFEAVGRQLTLTGPGGLDVTVNDSGNIGLLGPARCYGGFGTDGSIIQRSGWGSPGGYTFYPPAGLVNGDMYDIYGQGGGGGGGGGVNTWGNGGGRGSYAENYGTGTAADGSGSTFGSTIIGNPNAPTLGQPISITIGGGGPPGSSEYYATGEITYYYYGGNSGLSNHVNANYGSSGAPGGDTQANWGSGYVDCPGGAGGAAYGGAPEGGAGWSGDANDGWGLVNGSAPAYNGGNAFEWGQGGTGCYSGSNQTYQSDYYGTLGSHTYDYIYGVNGAQVAGYGYSGVMWVDSVSRQLPGSIASFAFWDAAIGGPQYVAVQPGTYTESTTSTTWADLATTSDELTVNVGPSGLVAVFISCEFAYNSVVNGQCFISLNITGANSLGSGYASSGMQTTIGADGQMANSLFGFYLMTGGNQGATIFKMKYLVNTGTGNFGPRYMLAIPF